MRALILIVFIGTACAVPQRITRIVGGSATTVDQYPYMCNMQYLYFGTTWSQACGGSLLTTRSVLSAAHCYYQDLESAWRVRVGTSYASSGGNVHLISELVLHEQYDNSNVNNDVAVIRLATPATLTPFVKVARIPGPNYNVPDNTVVMVVGWGALLSSGGAPEQLQHVDVNIINQQICAERYAYLKTLPGYQFWPDINSGMLCSGILNVGGKDACQGDSGGPVVYSGDVIVGITSWGFECADEFYPGVNTRVSYYSDWIVTKAST